MLASPMRQVAPHDLHRQAQFNSASASSHTNTIVTDSLAIPPPSKRPKLSLQTSLVPITYGKSSTALTVTASAIDTSTPTIMNTFNNAYSIPHRSSPVTNSPIGPLRMMTPLSRTASPIAARRDSQTHPYILDLPLGVKSILRNSPIPPSFRQSTNSASPATTRRVFFPPVKRVSFKPSHQLEEPIKTSIYVAAHSDLDSLEEDSDEVDGPDPAHHDDHFNDTDNDDDDDDEATNATSDTSHQQTDSKKRKIQLSSSDTKKIEAASLRESRGNLTPRRHTSSRKRRRWEWTLGPVVAVKVTQEDEGVVVSSHPPEEDSVEVLPQVQSASDTIP